MSVMRITQLMAGGYVEFMVITSCLLCCKSGDTFSAEIPSSQEITALIPLNEVAEREWPGLVV